MSEFVGLPIEKLTGDERPACTTQAHRGGPRPPADYKLTRPPDAEMPRGDVAYVCASCLATFLMRVAPEIEL